MEIYTSILQLDDFRLPKTQISFQAMLKESLIRNFHLLKIYSPEFRNISKKILPFKIRNFISSSRESFTLSNKGILQKENISKLVEVKSSGWKRKGISNCKFQHHGIIQNSNRRERKGININEFESKENQILPGCQTETLKSLKHFETPDLREEKSISEENSRQKQKKPVLNKVFLMHHRLSFQKSMIMQKRDQVFTSFIDKHKNIQRGFSTKPEVSKIEQSKIEKIEEKQQQKKRNEELIHRCEETLKPNVVWVGQKKNLYGEKIRIFLYNRAKQQTNYKFKVWVSANKKGKETLSFKDFMQNRSPVRKYYATQNNTSLSLPKK